MSTLLNLLKAKTRGEWILQEDSIFITDDSRFIIGPYRKLTDYSTALRSNRNQQNLLANLNVKFGRRNTDAIPKGTIIKGGFRSKIKNRKLTPSQLSLLIHQHHRERYDFNRIPGFIPRITDEYREAAAYFQSITLESHHIVEKSLINALNRAKGDLADDFAPCVLVTGELHRRMFTPVGKNFRDTSILSKPAMLEFYGKLYASPEFNDLKIATQLILDATFYGG